MLNQNDLKPIAGMRIVPGTPVYHEKFGEGFVVATYPTIRPYSIDVKFNGYAPKAFTNSGKYFEKDLEPTLFYDKSKN